MADELTDIGRGRADQRRRAGQRMIQMQDADRLTEGIDNVVVAIGIETIAAIVAGRRDPNAAPEHLVNYGNAAPAWRPTLVTVLQVHVDRRKRDDGDVSLSQ